MYIYVCTHTQLDTIIMAIGIGLGKACSHGCTFAVIQVIYSYVGSDLTFSVTAFASYHNAVFCIQSSYSGLLSIGQLKRSQNCYL